MPKGKCVLQLDGSTDIYKAKEIVGDRVCIQGDVPAALLTLGNCIAIARNSSEILVPMVSSFRQDVTFRQMQNQRM
jgi:uroporphyrinogen-III decarboxylase